MLVTALVDVDFGFGHGFEEESGSPGVIQVNVGHDDGPDVVWPQAERTDRFEDSLRVPRGPRLDDYLLLVVDQVDRPKGPLAEHADVGEVGLRIN